MNICPSCGTRFDQNAAFCPACGTPVPASQRTCLLYTS
ncbi:zinc-ribbon domain-containing protein, partial [Olsenella uli]|nr:zinc-ribbon domain-containing protein [Olsenella uli]